MAVVVASGYGKAELSRPGIRTPSINKPYFSCEVETSLSKPR